MKNMLELMRARLENAGGTAQQDRMINDKKRSFNKAVLYSYQGAQVRTLEDGAQIYRALINPNKVEQDYDIKVISVDYDSGYAPGTVFEWVRTKTKWLIYLQDLTELAYFKGDIRRCNYQIKWLDSENKEHSTYASVRGPVETKINFLQKEGISLDTPNHSLNILIPKTEFSLAYFKRYAKFYLSPIDSATVCWRVEAVDSISMPGVLEINATEYYANEDEDTADLAHGQELPKEDAEGDIKGQGFISPKISYNYEYIGEENANWNYDLTLPIEVKIDNKTISLKWLKNYSGQFVLSYGNTEKTIIVESLF